MRQCSDDFDLENTVMRLCHPITILALALLRLLPPGTRLSGQILFQGVDVLRLSQKAMRRVRRRGMGMIFEQPSAYLNPLFPAGWQVAEAVRLEVFDHPRHLLDGARLAGVDGDAQSLLASALEGGLVVGGVEARRQRPADALHGSWHLIRSQFRDSGP